MNHRFQVLDGFRGVAALMVAIYHLHVNGVITELNFVRNSYLFVEFFFVLSGFVIAYNYSKKILNVYDVFVFMKKRFARLWPLHFFMILLFVPFALLHYFYDIGFSERFSFVSFVANLFLVQALNLNLGMTWNIPAWSISVEFYTYVIFSFICLIKKNTFLYVGILVLSLFLLFKFSNMDDVSDLALFRCLYSFSLGVIASRVYKLLPTNVWFEYIVFFFVFGLLSFCDLSPTSNLAYLMPIFFFITVIVFSKESGLISKLFMNPLLNKLGILSFSIYLTHNWLILVLKGLLVAVEKLLGYEILYTESGRKIIDLGFGYGNDLIYLPYLYFVIVFSKFTYNYIERPFQQKITSL